MDAKEKERKKKTLRFLLLKKLLELLSVLKKMKISLAHWTLRKGFRYTLTLLWENKGGYCTEGHVFILPSQAWKLLDCKIVAHKSVEVRNWLNLPWNCHWFLSSNDCSVDWLNCSLFSEGKPLFCSRGEKNKLFWNLPKNDTNSLQEGLSESLQRWLTG